MVQGATQASRKQLRWHLAILYAQRHYVHYSRRADHIDGGELLAFEQGCVLGARLARCLANEGVNASRPEPQHRMTQ
jgi:hypothetical protein